MGFLLLLWAERKFAAWLKHGDLFAVYLIFYGVGRAALESTVRLDALTYGGAIPTAVLFGLGFLALGVVILLINHGLSGAKLKPQDPPLQANL